MFSGFQPVWTFELGRGVVRWSSGSQCHRTAGRQNAALERTHFWRRHPFELPHVECARALYVRVIDTDHFRCLIEPRGCDRYQTSLTAGATTQQHEIKRPVGCGRQKQPIELSNALIPSVQHIDAREWATCG